MNLKEYADTIIKQLEKLIGVRFRFVKHYKGFHGGNSESPSYDYYEYIYEVYPELYESFLDWYCEKFSDDMIEWYKDQYVEFRSIRGFHSVTLKHIPNAVLLFGGLPAEIELDTKGRVFITFYY